MIKIGGITVGQSPRDDITPDIWPIFGDKVELIQLGGLDGLTHEEIDKFAPQDGDYVLVSKMRDGSSVRFAEKYVLPRIQQHIETLEKQDVSLIAMFCTGNFPDVFHSNVPLIFPSKILEAFVPAVAEGEKLIVVTPDEKQLAQSVKKWSRYIEVEKVFYASPYLNDGRLEMVANEIKNLEGNFVVLDCMGYTKEMKDMVAKITGKRVILPRTLLARSIMELID